MKRIVWWLWLTGCQSPEILERGEVDGTDLLTGDPESDFAERVSPLGEISARLLPDAPPLTGSRSVMRALPVVDPGERPRVSIELSDVRVLLYLDREDLQPRIVSRANGSGPSGHGRAVLPVGAEVEVLERDGDRALVAFERFLLRVEAWLPRTAVDEVWRIDDAALDDGEPRAEGPSMSVLGGSELLEAPGGDPIAWIGGDEGEPSTMVTLLGEELRGYIPVRLDHAGALIEGFVHADDLSEDIAGWGCGCGGSFSSYSMGWGWANARATVPAGTLLRAGPGGPVVALVLEDIRVLEEAASVGAEIARGTPFGDVSLWAAPEDVVL